MCFSFRAKKKKTTGSSSLPVIVSAQDPWRLEDVDSVASVGNSANEGLVLNAETDTFGLQGSPQSGKSRKPNKSGWRNLKLSAMTRTNSENADEDGDLKLTANGDVAVGGMLLPTQGSQEVSSPLNLRRENSCSESNPYSEPNPDLNPQQIDEPREISAAEKIAAIDCESGANGISVFARMERAGEGVSVSEVSAVGSKPRPKVQSRIQSPSGCGDASMNLGEVFQEIEKEFGASYERIAEKENSGGGEKLGMTEMMENEREELGMTEPEGKRKSWKKWAREMSRGMLPAKGLDRVMRTTMGGKLWASRAREVVPEAEAVSAKNSDFKHSLRSHTLKVRQKDVMEKPSEAAPGRSTSRSFRKISKKRAVSDLGKTARKKISAFLF